jgi:hypothetical protein
VSFLDSVVEEWNVKNTNNLRSTVRRSEDNSKLIIEIETPLYLATIEAWEHASCLDVTTLKLSSTKGIIHSAGGV